MAASTLATIGGSSQNVFVGTPGVPGTGNTPSSVGGITNGTSPFSVPDPSTSLPSQSWLSQAENSVFGSSGNLFDENTPTDAEKAASSSSTSTLTEITGLFLRGVVIILGFIFVAVGLSMFKTSGSVVVENISARAVNHTRKTIGLKK